MIRDFLTHLGWELRLADIENHLTGPAMFHPEPVLQMRKYTRKYHCIGLVPGYSVDQDVDTDEEFEQAIAIINGQDIARIESYLAGLQALLPALQEALSRAEVHTDSLDGAPVVLHHWSYSAAAVLRGDERSGEGKDFSYASLTSQSDHA